MSIDSVEGDAGWREREERLAAGRAGLARASRATTALGITAVTIQARDPVAACERWCDAARSAGAAAATRWRSRSTAASIRFVAPVDDDGTGVVGLDIEVKDADAALDRARAAGLPVAGGAVEICGVVVRPVSI